MPGKLLDFLEHYIAFPEIEVKVQVPHSPAGLALAAQEKIRRKVVTESKDTIKDSFKLVTNPGEQESKEFSPSLIGRVFNEFPLEFSTMGSKGTVLTFQAIEASVLNNWLERLLDFLKNSKLTYVEESVLLKQKGGAVKEVSIGKIELAIDKERRITEKMTTEQMNALTTLVDEMIVKICDELLDEKGNLDKRAIHILGLNHIVKAYETLPLKSEEIKMQVLFSCFTQIILGNLIEPLNIKAGEELKNELVLMKQFVENLGALTLLIKNLLMQDKVEEDKEGNQVLKTPFSDHFKETVKESIKMRLTKTAQHCAIELANLTPQKATDLMDADFEKMQLIAEQLKSAHLESTKETTDLIKHKIQFWLEVCNFYREQLDAGVQKEKYYALMKIVFAWVTKQAISTQLTLTGVYGDIYTACEKASKELRDIKPDTNPIAPNEPVILEKIKKLLDADTNLYIIRELDKIGRLEIMKLKDMMLQPESLLRSTEEFLQTFLKQIGDREKGLGLGAYKEAFTRADFFLRVRSDINMLRNVFEQLPSELREYKIFDCFSKEGKLPLKNCIKKLNERLNMMKSTSDFKNYIELAIIHRGIVTFIINELFVAMNAYLKEKMIYIRANEEMLAVWQDYERFTQKMKHEFDLFNDLNKPIDVEKWKETLQETCKQYVVYLKEFSNISEGLQKLQEPSEGEILVREEVLKIKLDYFFREFKKVLPEEDHKVLLEIKKYISNKMSPLDFFRSQFDEILGKSAKTKPEQYERILKAYNEALERANFFLHVESSLKGLKIVFKQIPALNKNNLSDLEQLIQSSDDFSSLAEQAYPIFTKITDSMSTLVNEAKLPDNPAMQTALKEYNELISKMKNALNKQSNFNIINWQLGFREICEKYIAYTKAILSEKINEKILSELKLGFQHAELMRVVSDPSLFKEVVSASTKSTEIYTAPSIATVHAENLKRLKIDFPKSYKFIKTILDDFDSNLSTNIAEAVEFLEKLPPQVIKDISKYSTSSPEVMRQAKIHPKFLEIARVARNSAPVSDMEFASKYKDEKKVAPPEEKVAPTVSATDLAVILNELKHEGQPKASLIKQIKFRLNDVKLDHAEFIAMLEAEKQAVASKTISKMLAACIEKAKNKFHVPAVDIKNKHFLRAVELLAYADSAVPTSRTFTAMLSKTNDAHVPYLVSVAKIFVQQSLVGDSRPLTKEKLQNLKANLNIIKNFQNLNSTLSERIEEMSREVDKALDKTLSLSPGKKTS